MKIGFGNYGQQVLNSILVYFEVDPIKVTSVLPKAKYIKKSVMWFIPFIGVCELKNGERVRLKIETKNYGGMFAAYGRKGAYIMTDEDSRKEWLEILEEAQEYCHKNRKDKSNF